VQELAGATSADVRIAFGAGSLRIGALKDSGNLIEGTVATGRGERILRDFHSMEAWLTLSYAARACPSALWMASWRQDVGPRPVVVCADGAECEHRRRPIHARSFEPEVTDLRVSSGVGQTEVWLPAQGRVTARVSGGVGQLIVTIPKAWRPGFTAPPAGRPFVAPRFARQGGGDYVSANYATADDRVDLDISAESEKSSSDEARL